MKIDKAVLNETKFVALGTLFLSIIMHAVFLIIGKWDLTVLWGNLLSGIPAVINFFLMGLTVQKACSETGKKAENFMRISMFLRMVLLFAVVIIGAVNLDTFNLVALLVPLFFPRIAIAFRPLFGHRIEAEPALAATQTEGAEETDTAAGETPEGGEDE